ncbi:MAG: hypothetical protein OMM_06837 [Candidatus Magnetoglobus multicellularis str. Araruama]|uniref:Uncharacterized protein n=1 Tax=Candidatus Magnetoglobus multicellularis str. Araruama TaxID=890399 RepID=A0A1V1PFS8_9BACT|nr:MAG: hypothetical protein OMM_06837 [Candidatus Magnetoglobus multicellularis str. Araruama]
MANYWLKTEAATPFQIQPQQEWEELQKRLNEKVKRSANMLLNRLELKRTGRKIVNTGVLANNNFAACVVLSCRSNELILK